MNTRDIAIRINAVCLSLMMSIGIVRYYVFGQLPGGYVEFFVAGFAFNIATFYFKRVTVPPKLPIIEQPPVITGYLRDTEAERIDKIIADHDPLKAEFDDLEMMVRVRERTLAAVRERKNEAARVRIEEQIEEFKRRNRIGTV